MVEKPSLSSQSTPLPPQGGQPGAAPAGKIKILILSLALALAVVMGAGIFWLFFLSSSEVPVGVGWYIFSFAAGLSMIVLPCTLPLAFVIVPLVMGKGLIRGLGIGLAFSLGISITLSMYGVLAAIVGEVAIGTLGAPLETVKNWLYLIAGFFAFIFALGALGFVRVRMPSYSGSAPMFIQKQQEYIKALLLGLFLGNIGIGCPHPATPVILTRIAASGDVFYGWLLFFVHALGRVVPLLFLAILGILGVNGLSWLVKRREKIEHMTGWAMVFVAGFILVLGLFTHDWWVYSGLHSLLESFTQEERLLGIISERTQTVAPHSHGLEEVAGKTGLFGLPLALGSWALVLLWVAPIWWNWFREKRRISALPDQEKSVASKIHQTQLWVFILLTLGISVSVLYTIPHWFQKHKALEPEQVSESSTVQVFLMGTTFESGEKSRITVVLKDEKGNPLGDIVESHERFVHFIIISEDFSAFSHLHSEEFGLITEDTRRKGEYSIEYIFPKPGRYYVAVDFSHEAHDVSKQFFVEVSGPRENPTIVKDRSREKVFDGYTVSFASVPKLPLSGKAVILRYHIEKDGKPVIDLKPYLGAPMHFAITDVNLTNFQHTHGEVHTLSPDRFGPDIEAHVSFPYAGLYQVFAQFKHEEKVVLTSFMLDVEPGEEGMGTFMNSGGRNH